jgi:hypothetical protein
MAALRFFKCIYREVFFEIALNTRLKPRHSSCLKYGLQNMFILENPGAIMSRYIVLTFVSLLAFITIFLVFDSRPQEGPSAGSIWASESLRTGQKVDIKPQKIEVKLKENEKQD